MKSKPIILVAGEPYSVFYEIFFKSIKNKTYFSLNKYIYSQLKKLGVNNLEIINKNTFDPKNNFYSARRSIKNKEFDYGRNISMIMINKKS